MGNNDKKLIEKLTKIFQTKKVIKLQAHSSSDFKYNLKSLSGGRTYCSVIKRLRIWHNKNNSYIISLINMTS